MEKLTRTARVINNVLTVVLWITIASFVFMVPAQYMAVTGGDMAEGGWMRIGGVTVNLSDMSQGAAVRAWAISSVLYGIMTAALCVGIVMLRRIIKPMRDGKPFDSAVSERLRRLGWYSLICGVISALYELFGKNIVMRLIMPESGTVSVEHNVNIWLFLIASLIYLFSYIFRYGEELQQLSDETL